MSKEDWKINVEVTPQEPDNSIDTHWDRRSRDQDPALSPLKNERAKALDFNYQVKQERYLVGEGKDKIDLWAEQYTHERFRHVMYGMIDKYECRLGKKAPIHEEIGKMLDYMNRWHQYELQWAKEKAQ